MWEIRKKLVWDSQCIFGYILESKNTLNERKIRNMILLTIS